MQTRTVLITGSTSGIGLAIARAFASRSYNIIFNGLETNGESIARGIASEFNINYFFSDTNLLHPGAIQQMVNAGMERFGVIDVLVNNAGIQFVSAIEDFPEEKWNDIIATNLSAPFHLTKAVWQGMKAQQFGRIINIASAHGLFASEYKSAYVASKHGIIGLTKTAALEGARLGITCNAICPGYVKTSLIEKQVADQARLHNLPEEEVIQKVILSKQAIKEFVPAQTIGEVCVFLASEAAAIITGIAMPVDGGWSAQ
jgi:3-hydroxybutyrate dehydrogenase